MNSTSNLQIIDETIDTRQKVYYVSRINQRLPWPSNSVIAEFVSGGVHKKFRILSIGDPNVKVVQIK